MHHKLGMGPHDLGTLCVCVCVCACVGMYTDICVGVWNDIWARPVLFFCKINNWAAWGLGFVVVLLPCF